MLVSAVSQVESGGPSYSTNRGSVVSLESILFNRGVVIPNVCGACPRPAKASVLPAPSNALSNYIGPQAPTSPLVDIRTTTIKVV
jgi:hypothetical protein